MPREFVWTERLTSVLEQVPEGPDRDALARGCVEYLALGIEPSFEYPLSAIFCALMSAGEPAAPPPKATQEAAEPNEPTADDGAAAQDDTEPEAEFVPPTLDEVCAYVARKGYEDTDPEDFLGYYQTHGWRSGNKPIKSWRRALAMWNGRNKRNRAPDFTLDNVRAYVTEQGYSLDPDHFYDYYVRREGRRKNGVLIDDFRPVCDDWERRDRLEERKVPPQVAEQAETPEWYDSIEICEYSNEGVHAA